jgi:cyanophycinase-like exopeptidase
VQTITEPGFVLMGGGTDVDEAFKWMIDRSGGGDFVVIRATGTNAYDSYIYGLGSVNSVETIIINSVTKANKANIEQNITGDSEIIKTIVVPGRLVNFVVKH